MFRKNKAQIVFAVLVNKQNYEAGELIEGNILFRKDRSVKFEKIRARFTGTAQYQVDDKVKSYSIPENTEFSIVSEKGKLPEGDSMYPIKFSVPITLPPSTHYPPAEIKYEIQAELLFNGKSITSSVDIYVHQAKTTNIATTFTDKKDWGLLHKETLLIRCIPDKVLYLPEEKIQLDLNISNMTKKDLVRVIITLQSTLKCGKKFHETSTICEKEISRDLFPCTPNTK